ncbi:hypothetical protein D9M71_405070 [compost metagenome]
MGERRHGRFDDFGGDGAVTLHDIPRDFLVAVVGGVRDDPPAILRGQRSRLLDGIVVVAGNADDLRTVGGDGRFPLDADIGMEHDDAAATDAPCSRSQRAAVVSVGCADHGELRQGRGVPAGEQVAGSEVVPGERAQDQANQGDRRTQRLEAAQLRTYRFVLDQDFSHAQFVGQIGQRVQWRSPAVQTRPLRQPLAALVGLADAHDVPQGIGIGLAGSVGVCNQHVGLRWQGRQRTGGMKGEGISGPGSGAGRRRRAAPPRLSATGRRRCARAGCG